MVKVAGVRFKTAGKVYYFDPGELKVSAGDHVIVCLLYTSRCV